MTLFCQASTRKEYGSRAAGEHPSVAKQGLARLSSVTAGPRQLSPCYAEPALAKQTAARLGDMKAFPGSPLSASSPQGKGIEEDGL